MNSAAVSCWSRSTPTNTVRSHGVVSLPTIKIFRHGQVVDTLHGAESEDTVREFMRKHVGDPSTTLLQDEAERVRRYQDLLQASLH